MVAWRTRDVDQLDLAPAQQASGLCVPQAPSLVLVVLKTVDHLPELMGLNPLTHNERLGQLLRDSVRAWAEGRFNLGDTPEAVDTGKDMRIPAAVLIVPWQPARLCCIKCLVQWAGQKRKPSCPVSRRC